MYYLAEPSSQPTLLAVIYPEVEQPAVAVIKVLLTRNNLLKDDVLERQSSNSWEEPAVSCVKDGHWVGRKLSGDSRLQTIYNNNTVNWEKIQCIGALPSFSLSSVCSC